MALAPVSSRGDEPDAELTDLSSRLWLGIAYTAPLLLPMLGEIPGLGPWQNFSRGLLQLPFADWIQLGLATVVVFWCGSPFLQRAWKSIVHFSPNMFTLIALGVLAAYGASVAASVAPQWFQASGMVHTYYETAAMITVLVLLGQVLELRARRRTGQAIRSLIALAPRTAIRLRSDGSEEEVPVEKVQVGDHLRIRPGEKVPVDGIVVDGQSAIDESMISGEPMPVAKKPMDPVTGGTLNGLGSLIIRAERVGSDTLLAHIIELVSQAQRSKAPVQRLADQVAEYFVPIVLAVSLLTFAGWFYWGAPPRLPRALLHAVAVLIIACPCALGLATPMAVTVGIGQGALGGILIRDADALERLARADILIVDKTGTLTEGKPKLVEIEPADGMDGNELLRLAASLERPSEHPLAIALVEAARARGLDLVPVRDFLAIPGQGVSGTIDGRTIHVGTPVFLAVAGITIGDQSKRLEAHRTQGATALLVAIDGKFAGLFAVADAIRETTPEAIANLRDQGLEIMMLTGDSRTTAQTVASRLGIDRVVAEVSPLEKQNVVAEFQGQGRHVAYAGDGVNDAPALAKADVGIALGTGTDVAIESASVTLVRGDLRAIARAVTLSRKTMNTIRQNLFLAFIYNVLSIPAAALGFLNPIWASAAMMLSSLSVVGNSLRLRREPTGSLR
jgi:Cu+-exporting ATPase